MGANGYDQYSTSNIGFLRRNGWCMRSGWQKYEQYMLKVLHSLKTLNTIQWQLTKGERVEISPYVKDTYPLFWTGKSLFCLDDSYSKLLIVESKENTENYEQNIETQCSSAYMLWFSQYHYYFLLIHFFFSPWSNPLNFPSPPFPIYCGNEFAQLNERRINLHSSSDCVPISIPVKIVIRSVEDTEYNFSVAYIYDFPICCSVS